MSKSSYNDVHYEIIFDAIIRSENSNSQMQSPLCDTTMTQRERFMAL